MDVYTGKIVKCPNLLLAALRISIVQSSDAGTGRIFDRRL